MKDIVSYDLGILSALSEAKEGEINQWSRVVASKVYSTASLAYFQKHLKKLKRQHSSIKRKIAELKGASHEELRR